MIKFQVAFLSCILLFLSDIMAQLNIEQTTNEIELLKINGKNPEAAALLNKLAFYYWESENNEKAIEAFEQSVTLNKVIGNENALKGIYSNMGMINSDMGQPEAAILYFRKSLLISKNMNNKQDVGTNLMNISIALQALDRNKEALGNLEKALEVILETNNKNLIRSCYGNLSEVHEKLGNSQKSMEYFSLYASFQNQLQQDQIEKEKQKANIKVKQSELETKKAIKEKAITEQKLEVTQDSLKVSEEINIKKQMQIDLQAAQLRSQHLLNVIFISGTVFLFIIALIVLWSLRQKKKHNIVLAQRNDEIKAQNDQIKNKNNKISQSINYARNIQGALLPEMNDFSKLFEESFILFKPRDVVSGDFYWFLSNEINDKVPKGMKFFAAVDCTGHGVPGAFMSMLGLSFLEEIVLDHHIYEPVDILEEMHVMIKAALKQEHSGNTDGMDMALCVYHEEKKEIRFAGAVNPLVLVQDGELLVEKGEFFGIGGQMKADGRKFSQKVIDVSKPIIGYIYSDGFADQFGGPKGQKYFTKNFKNLLLDIHDKPMDEQRQILESTLENWIGKEYQRVDDILVMGFRVN